MKAAQKFALGIGLVYLAIGLMGFIPALVSQPETLPGYVEELGVTSGYGYLLGLFPVNTPHNIIHLVTGGLGILTSIALDSSRLFSGQLGIYYLTLAVLGMVPVANTFFGLFPIYGVDVLLHGLTGLLGIYFGFFATPSLRTLFRRELKEDAVSGEVME
ncbi:DUF4383 domain-containing protein [Nodosilinea sp. E11]|uniref:DUF4383 domain-containing protein n=1 Tax=Nodosilinea sp. E11 TaxID=3037479 RepID=UPI00293456C4|nr:DUF4383 domain-containing protein [Nodosilinea sp. E11]WOD39080.1 DUF4383 domain-containing protein [Nodosilinea sp. E11]